MQEKTIKVSILVPVYNVEPYLPECIQSALNQTYKNFEIVLVDDGSIDASGAICDRYAAEYDMISVYHTENRGEVRARECAMQHANGEFFVFLDADDRLRSNALEVIVAAIKKYKCDCVIFRLARLIDGKTSPVPQREKEEVLTNKCDIYRKCLIGGGYNSLCTKAVKATVFDTPLHNSAMPRISLGGDLVQSLTVFRNSNSIAFIDDVLYEYRYNPSSITHTISCNAYIKSLNVRKMVFDFLEQEQCLTAQDFEDFRQMCVEKHVDEIFRICAFNLPIKDKLYMMRELGNTQFFREFLRQGKPYKLSYKRRVIYTLHRMKWHYAVLICARIYRHWLTR